MIPCRWLGREEPERKKTRRTLVSRESVLHSIDLRRENRAWKFPFVRIFDGNGSTKMALHLGANGQYDDESCLL